MGLYRWWSASLTGLETPERIQGFLVTANFLDVLGVKPALGRGFAADENQPGKDSVAILTHGLWQRRFGSDPEIVNKTITLNGVNCTVIGVMPEGFNYPAGAEVLAPLAITPELARSRQSHSYYVVGRLKPEYLVGPARRPTSPRSPLDLRKNMRNRIPAGALLSIRSSRIQCVSTRLRCWH